MKGSRSGRANSRSIISSSAMISSITISAGSRMSISVSIRGRAKRRLADRARVALYHII